jgi:hypothetical protein
LNELPKRELALTPAEKAQRLASIKSELFEAERLEIALIAMHPKIRAASLRIGRTLIPRRYWESQYRVRRPTRQCHLHS